MATPERKVDDSQSLVKVLNEAMPDLRRLAPKYVNLNRLMALALEARLRNPTLAKSSVASVIAFCKRCAEWGTDRVGAGGVWAVPFWNNKTGSYDMQAIPDWRLLVEKAKKAKAITHATADVVREGDRFSYSRGMVPDLTHEPLLGGTGEVIAAYCCYTLPDGTRDFVVMSRAELDGIRGRSKAWQTFENDKTKTCPYNTDPEEMMKKTVIKRALKLFEGASIELTTILEADHRAMGFADITETPEPITMPRAIEAAPEEAKADTEQPAEEKKAEETTGTQPAKTTGPVISEAQSKRMYAISKGVGRSDENIHKVLKHYGYEHSNDVCRSDYEAICNELSQQPAADREPGAEGCENARSERRYKGHNGRR